VRGAEGERRREKQRVVEAWRRRERESGTRNAGIDSRRRRRQPAASLKHTTNRAKSTRFRDKKKPNSRVSKRAEKRERERERGRERKQKSYVISIGSSLQIALEPLQMSFDIFGQFRNAIKPSLHKPNIYFSLSHITVTCYVTVM